MKEELEAQLVKDYPILYRDYGGDMRYTCMHWGFSHGDGWFEIINDLSKKITEISEATGIKVIADQVKEKFGGLRFYYHIENCDTGWFNKLDYKIRTIMCSRGYYKLYWKLHDFRKKFWRSAGEKVEDLVAEAETLSYKTCEVCGQPGKTEGGGWVSTLCNTCRDKR